VNPEPNATAATFMPRLRRPASSASCMSSGIVAAVVLPKRWMLWMTFSSGMPRVCWTYWLMRKLA
jgi:hypothetical protein